MDTLILEDFRCFADRHEVPIRPLTLLVGENSTGKTSFLAAVRAAYDLRWSPSEMRFLEGFGTPDFNEEPFRLGSYDQIANYRAGRAGRAKSFVIGQQFTADSSPRMPRTQRGNRKSAVKIEARFAVFGSQPVLPEFRVASDDHELIIKNIERGQASLISFFANGHTIFQRRPEEDEDLMGNIFLDLFVIGREVEEGDARLTPQGREKLLAIIDSILYGGRHRSYAFAPIRTSPQRTYDPIKEIRDPEGSHVPMLLARMLSNDGSPDFKMQMEGFGVDSGLYSDIGIRRVGRKESDPFQIEIKQPHGGPWRNLVDVGYGVSQSIPIIADAVSTEPGTTLLIQQPEVHLHPRAQAAMGSFFVHLADSERNRLVVETHSDYLVDRVRMEVRDERIKASDVVILYFEQGSHGVGIHPITIDAMGNLENAPANYGGFFLEEQRRFFMID